MTPQQRDDVITRDQHRCQRCGRTLTGFPYSIHHRKGRHCADPDGMANLICLCGTGTTGCHGWVHQHPAESYERGFMVHRNQLATPEQVPIRTAYNSILLTPDGKVLQAPTERTI